jgi:hypothetical protein
MSMHLSREGLIAGPSSGEALKGLLDYIGEQKKLGTLARHADETTGEISCVFTSSDLPYHYLPQYFQKLGADEFPSIQNQVWLHRLPHLVSTNISRSFSNATNFDTTKVGFSNQISA